MMGVETKISWTDHTFNPWRGCSKYSPGCDNCYAEAMSRRNPAVLGEWGPTGKRIVAAESYWRTPVQWDRAAAADGVRRRVFCASLADVFEDWAGPMLDSHGTELCICHGCGEWMYFNERECKPDCRNDRCPRRLTMQDVRARLFKLIDATPNLNWLLLTKRPENILRMLPLLPDGTESGEYDEYLPNNVWLGTSIESDEYTHRADTLRRIPEAVRFISAEPLLGPLPSLNLDGIHQVIVGGESRPDFRPMHPDWARDLRDRCRAAGVAFFYKQGADRFPGRLTELDGETIQQFPSPRLPLPTL